MAAAIATQQNQPVTTGGASSLWALKSNELQIHLSVDPDGTKRVLPSDICGTIPTAGYTSTTSTAIAYASGDGQTTAFAAVGPNGEALAFAQVIGQGQAFAFVQVTRHILAGGRVHVVQRGENLFRIALRYGHTVSVLSAANGITNPNLIYAGQVLVIP